MPRALAPDTRAKIERLLAEGYTATETARRCGVHVNTVQRMKGATKTRPITGLSPEAQRALKDFGYFRARYLGRMSTPWQEDAAYKMVALLETNEREYVVVNVAPGSGKSTLFTHDIPAWVATRNRAIRCMIGSATQSTAKNYTSRLRRTFEREHILKADTEKLAAGLAIDAQATLQADFGRFKPSNNDLWRNDEFILAQPGGITVEDKEPSFVAYGRDSGFLGGRFDLVIWDDLVTRKTMRTEDGRDELYRWYEDEAETRVEPGGLFILQGQRMDSSDLYRYALDMTTGEYEEFDETADPDAEKPKKYHHVVYKAHYDELCKKEHHIHSSQCADKCDQVEAKHWPKGCLLDPYRLSYKFLAPLMQNRAEKFQVLYQQEDIDNQNALVKPVWIKGGKDPDTGIEHPGCLDSDRQAGQVPAIFGETYSVVSIDPSPTKYFSIQWWVIHPDTKRRILIDHVRAKLDINEVLTRDELTREYSGILVDWLDTSRTQRHPITHIIFEQNGAQKFWLANPAVQQWAAKNHITLIPHTTSRNRSDPEYGVQILAPLYQHGLIRLPYKGLYGMKASQPLISELTRYPDSATDDCIMAQWFLEHQMDNIVVRAKVYRMNRPSWLASA